jgi:hypothetical protein
MSLTTDIMDRIDRHKDLLEVAKRIEAHKPTGMAAYPGLLGKRIIIQVTSMEGLHEARSMLRRALGSWRDRRGLTWGSGNIGNTEWIGQDHPVEIRFSCMYDRFPDCLNSGGSCGFRKVSTSHLEYVCDVSEG